MGNVELVLLYVPALLVVLLLAAREARTYLERRAIIKLLNPVKIPAQRAQEPPRVVLPQQRRAPIDRY
jgi:hypothetical protein